MARPGAVLSRAQLEDRLYGWGEEIESNAVSVYIHQLRSKLGADFIRNVRGVGYFDRREAAPDAGAMSLDPRAPAGRRCSALLALAPRLMGGDHLPQRARRDRGDLRLPAAADGAVAARPGRDRAGQAGTLADEQLDFVIQIWTVDGRSIYASRAHSSLPARALLGLPTLEVEGRAWRTYSVATRERVIQVAQPVEIRQRLAAARRLAQRPAAAARWRRSLALAIWWLAAQHLAPLDAWRATLRARDAQSLAPLPTERPARRGGAAGERAQRAARAAAQLARRAARVRRRCGARAALAAHRAEAAARAAAPRAGDEATRAAARSKRSPTASTAPPGWSSSCSRWRAASRARRCAPRERVDLLEVARQAVADDDAVRATRARSSSSCRADGRSFVAGEPTRARACWSRNLVDNAVRYSPPGSRVDVSVGGGRDAACTLHGRRRRARHPAGRAASASSTASTAAPRRRVGHAASAWRSFAASPSAHGATVALDRLARRRPARDACASRAPRRAVVLISASSTPNQGLTGGPYLRRQRGTSAYRSLEIDP